MQQHFNQQYFIKGCKKKKKEKEREIYWVKSKPFKSNGWSADLKHHEMWESAASFPLLRYWYHGASQKAIKEESPNIECKGRGIPWREPAPADCEIHID